MKIKKKEERNSLNNVREDDKKDEKNELLGEENEQLNEDTEHLLNQDTDENMHFIQDKIQRDGKYEKEWVEMKEVNRRNPSSPTTSLSSAEERLLSPNSATHSSSIARNISLDGHSRQNSITFRSNSHRKKSSSPKHQLLSSPTSKSDNGKSSPKQQDYRSYPEKFNIVHVDEDDDEFIIYNEENANMLVSGTPRFPLSEKMNSSSIVFEQERKIELLPEIDFLNLIQHENSPQVIEDWIQKRVMFLRQNDDAAKMSRLPFWKLAIYRCPAIVLTLVLEMVVGFVISRYNHLLAKHILLTSFMPVLSSVSGNIGLQASTATLRSLATGHTSHDSFKDIMKLIVKELASASIIATLSGIALSVISGIWSGSFRFAITTGLSILLSASLSGVIGCLSPVTFKNLNIDPAVTAGPFETAIQDILGISLYLTLATFILT